MIHTFWPEYARDGTELSSNYAPLVEAVEDFISEVEDNGLYE